ncbi:MAG TPA: thiamine phosphate synthase [Candidatus Binatia bacterium]|nr:thiamine phosphate synthase [Candidatus Binatia bacterium]
MPQPNFDLYLITDRKLTQGRDLIWVLEKALEGGVNAIQLREKDLSGRELFNLAEQVNRLCQRYQAQLFINDRVDVALAVEATGVHLGEFSMPVLAARSLLGARRSIGVSVHSLEGARRAVQHGADFIVFGPVYFTPSKADLGAPQGLNALQLIVENISLAVYAIGGIKAKNLLETKSAGIRGVALISAIMSAEDPTFAAKEILTLLRR